MNTKTILYGVAAFAVAALLVKAISRKAPLSGDAERLSGVQSMYSTNTAQQQVTQAAIAASWADIARATNSQPDWWI